MLLATLEQSGFGNLMFLLWSTLLGGSFVFLDTSPSILFLVFSFCCPFFLLLVLLWLFYDWQGFMTSWAFLTQTFCMWWSLSSFRISLSVPVWLVLSSKRCGYHIMEVMPEKMAYSHKNCAIFGSHRTNGRKVVGWNSWKCSLNINVIQICCYYYMAFFF